MELTAIETIANMYKLDISRIKYSEDLDQDDPLISKIMGIPYWEANNPYPIGPRKQPLCFLAQINFSDVRGMSSLYPDHGILQFFIDADNLGLNYDQPYMSKNYQVKYWESPDLVKFVDTYNNLSWESPANKPLKMLFGEVRSECCGGSDEYHFSKIYGELIPDDCTDDAEDVLYEILFDQYDNSGSKIGGYAYFTQGDPRMYNQFERNEILGLPEDADPDWLLLFQMDSDHEELMWGDSGVANWFITREDLMNRRFDRVLFNWDCC